MLVVAVLAAGCGGRALAADSATADAKSGTATATAQTPKDSSRITSLDEIVVSGKLDTLSGIRQALIDADDRFNARYNALNSDHDYDIVCRLETPTGSHIAIRLCQARIVDELTAAQGRTFFRNLSSNATTLTGSPDSVRKETNVEVARRTLALLKTDPELQHDLLEHLKLEQLYKDLREKKPGSNEDTPAPQGSPAQVP